MPKRKWPRRMQGDEDESTDSGPRNLKSLRGSLAVWVCGCGLLFAYSCDRSDQKSSDATAQNAGAATEFASNGARIFYTSQSVRGTPILSAPAFGLQPVPAGRSCSDCHGADGGGGALQTDSGWVRTPGIAYARLSSPETYQGGEAYAEATLALTLRTGVRVDGYLLSPLMPRWQMSNEDMDDLITHLKTLDAHAAPDAAR